MTRYIPPDYGEDEGEDDITSTDEDHFLYQGGDNHSSRSQIAHHGKNPHSKVITLGVNRIVLEVLHGIVEAGGHNPQTERY